MKRKDDGIRDCGTKDGDSGGSEQNKRIGFAEVIIFTCSRLHERRWM